MGDMKSESSDVVFEMVRSVLTEFNDGVEGADVQLRILWENIFSDFLSLIIGKIVYKSDEGWISCETRGQDKWKARRWLRGKGGDRLY